MAGVARASFELEANWWRLGLGRRRRQGARRRQGNHRWREHVRPPDGALLLEALDGVQLEACEGVPQASGVHKLACGRQEPGNLVPVVLAGVRQGDVPGDVGAINSFGCHGVTQRGVRTSRRPELGAKAASRGELRRHARLAYVATCMNALRDKKSCSYACCSIYLLLLLLLLL